jgi:transcriptional regulator
MLEQPVYTVGTDEVRELIARRGWATLVSGGAQPVVSHLPILLESPPESPSESPDEVSVLGHLAKADAELHELGQHDVVLIIEGPNGYISPTFYQAGPYVSTWNFVVAHLHGRPEVLDADDTWTVLAKTVEHFESFRPQPWQLDTVDDFARSIAPRTTGFRLSPTRVVGKAKLSQDKPAEVVERVITALETDPVHGHAILASAMRAHRLSAPPKQVGEYVGDSR